MSPLKKTLFLMSLSVVFLMLGSTYFTTFTSLRLFSLDFSETQIASVHMAFAFGFVIGTLKSEFLIQKIGHKKAFILLTLLFSFSTLLNQYFESIFGWIACRFISGICLSAIYVILESLYLIVSPTEKRGQVLAIYMVSLYLSQSMSQFFHQLIPIESVTIFWILGGLIFSSAIPMGFLPQQGFHFTDLKMFSILRKTKVSSLGLHASFISGVILTALYSFLPLVATKLELNVSLSMSLMILGGLSMQWPIGLLSDRFDRKKLLLGLCLLCSIPCLIPLLVPVSPIFLYILIAVMGGVSFGLYPLSMTLVTENKPKEEITVLTTLLVLLYSFGMIFGPMLTPFFNQFQSTFGLYVELILFTLILGSHALYLLRKNPNPTQIIE